MRIPFHFYILSCVLFLRSQKGVTQNNLKPADIIETAIARSGGYKAGEIARKIRVIYRGTGNNNTVYQGRFNTRQFLTARMETVIINMDSAHSARREDYIQPDETFAMWLSVNKGEQGVRINLKSPRSINMKPADALAEYENNLWRIPQLALQRMKNEMGRLSYTGIRLFSKTNCHVVKYEMQADVSMNILFEKSSGLLKGYSFSVQSLTGPVELNYIFKSYVANERLSLFPSGYIVELGGNVYRNMDVFDVRPSETVSYEPWFDWLKKDLPPVLRIVLQETKPEKIASHAWIMRNIGGYNALIADIGEGLLVMDAPGSFPIAFPMKSITGPADLGAKLAEEIHKHFPGKKILYVVLTHHHSDHFGAVAMLAKEGATIVTTPGNLQLAKKAGNGALVKIVKDSMVFGSGSAKLVVYSLSTMHSDENLFAYLPSDSLIYEADISDYVLPSKQFLQFIDKKKLDIKKIYSTHSSANYELQDMEYDEQYN